MLNKEKVQEYLNNNIQEWDVSEIEDMKLFNDIKIKHKPSPLDPLAKMFFAIDDKH